MHPNDIITFWFEDTTEAQKWKKDPAFDALIKERFEPTYWDIMEGNTTHWRVTPQGRLAEIIVLDQFARNMFRGDAQSFAGDPLALDLAHEAVVLGVDQELPPTHRKFLYMPYMHSESQEVHEEALRLFTSLGDEHTLKFEHAHKDIIDRFGRYPHRNDVLGRNSTPEEKEFLEIHSGF